MPVTHMTMSTRWLPESLSWPPHDCGAFLPPSARHGAQPFLALQRLHVLDLADGALGDLLAHVAEARDRNGADTKIISTRSAVLGLLDQRLGVVRWCTSWVSR